MCEYGQQLFLLKDYLCSISIGHRSCKQNKYIHFIDDLLQSNNKQSFGNPLTQLLILHIFIF